MKFHKRFLVGMLAVVLIEQSRTKSEKYKRTLIDTTGRLSPFLHPNTSLTYYHCARKEIERINIFEGGWERMNKIAQRKVL